MGVDGFAIMNEVLQAQRQGVPDLRPAVDLNSAGFRLTDITADVLQGEAAPIASTGTNVSTLPSSPADPRWRYRIPPPDCMRCNQPHLPGRGYDHEYHDGSPKETPPPMTDALNGAAQTGGIPNIGYGVTGGVGRRVAVYVGRGETFVLKVEENPPDWDDCFSQKVSRDAALLVRSIVKALGIKFKDATGGELEDDELAEDRPKPASRVGASHTRDGFEAACRELGLDPEQVRAAGVTGNDRAGADGQPYAAGSEPGDGAEDQG